MTKDGVGRHGGNNGENDRREAEQDKKSRSELEGSLSGSRDRDEREGHTSGKR